MDNAKPVLEKRVDKLREPFAAFIGSQTTASAFLLAALLAALLFASSPFAGILDTLKHYPLSTIFGKHTVEWSLLHLVNDGLIALFFFLIGLEVKRELLAGELQQPERIGLIISAAIGRILMPAIFYLLINLGFENGAING